MIAAVAIPSERWSWFRVPTALYERLRDAGRAVGVYVALARHANEAGESWPSQRTIAGVVGLSERSVRQHLATLERAGLIQKARRRRDTQIYVLPHIIRSGSGLPVKDGETGSGLPVKDGETGSGLPVKDGETGSGLPVKQPKTGSSLPQDRQISAVKTGSWLPQKKTREEDQERERSSSTATDDQRDLEFWDRVVDRAKAASGRMRVRPVERADRSLLLKACALVEEGTLPESWLADATAGVALLRDNRRIKNVWGYLHRSLENGAAERHRLELIPLLARIKVPEELLRPPARNGRPMEVATP